MQKKYFLPFVLTIFVLVSTKCKADDAGVFAYANKFNLKLQQIVPSSKLRSLIYLSMLAPLITWFDYNLHLKKTGMRSITKKPEFGLSEKLDIKNLLSHMRYYYYKMFSYLAYQDEDNKWHGALPIIDKQLSKMKKGLKSLKERVDVFIFAGLLTKILYDGKLTAELAKWTYETTK